MSEKNNSDKAYRPRIFEVLRTFGSDELGRFYDFIRSRYFNRNKKAVMLFKYISRYHPLFTSVELTKEKMFSVISAKKFNESTLRNAFSCLLQLAESFIAVENIRAEHGEWNYLVLKALTGRNLRALSKISLAKQEASLEGSHKIGMSFFMQKCRLETEKINFALLNDSMIKTHSARRQTAMLDRSKAYVMILFSMEMISDQINLFIMSGRFSLPEISRITENILKDYNLVAVYRKVKNKTEYSFILLLYIKLLKAYTNTQNLRGYFEYRREVEKYSDLLDSDELYFHYNRLASYMILKTNELAANTGFRKELFRLFNTILINEYYKNNKTRYITPVFYRNMVLLAVQLHRGACLKDLVNNRSISIAPQHSENLAAFAGAFLSYEESDYNGAMRHINSISIDSFIYKYDMYNLKLKIFYDTAEYDGLLDLIQTYMQYIRNDALLPAKTKVFYRNYAFYLRKLVLYKTGKTEIDVRYKLHKLTELQNVVNKDWLIAKYEETLRRRISRAV